MKKCVLRVWNFMNAWCVCGMKKCVVRLWNEEMRGAHGWNEGMHREFVE
jgi:hypothetical protein